MSVFRILSFDGGGIKGALSTALLKRITDKYPELLKQTDLFAGTSTGSIIALALAYNQPVSLIDEFYSYDTIKYVFTPKRPNYFIPRYRNIHLTEKLETVFPSNLTLAQLPRFVFVPSFNVKGYTYKGFEEVFFTNFVNNATITERVIDTALYSSAAPTYFPSVHNFIDGGVFLASPTAAPVIYIRSVLPRTYQLADFRLLSIGTGFYPQRILKNTKNWGLMQWAMNPGKSVSNPLIDVLLTANVPIENRYSYELLKQNYFKLNPDLPKAIAMDDYKAVPLLKELASSFDLSDTYRYIEKFYLD